MKIIIRDDDTSYFTEPARLERIYERLWQAGLPVALAVIPAHRANIIVDDRFIDPNIPPAYRGQDAVFPLTDNPTICDYLREAEHQGRAEICLHGYDHNWREFDSSQADDLRWRVEQGAAILSDYDLKTFVPPYGHFSATARTIVDATGLTAVQPDGTYGTMPLVRCSETDLLDKARAHADSDAVLMCVNHWWMFYQDWDEIDGERFAAWQDTVDALLVEFKDTIRTFADGRHT